MQPTSLARPLWQGASIALLLVLGFSRADAQCDITGPVTLCGGTAELCGPPGPYFYDWRDASGNAIGDQRCLVVSAPGTYRLSTFDFINGLGAGPCEHIVGVGGANPPSCLIDGPTTPCANTVAQLCAPEGVDEYQWTGPEEFTAASRCIDVNSPGLYTVRTRNAATGCWSAVCERNVSFSSCDAPKNYPVTPSALGTSCRSTRTRPRGLFDQAQMSALARSVDEHAASFTWRDPADGMCRTLNDCRGLRDRARRQFAGVMANVCMQQLKLVPRTGPVRGLDPVTIVQLPGFSGAVSEWLAITDARLRELDRRPPLDRKTKDAYRSIIRVGWSLNHGLGIGTASGSSRMVAGDAGAALDADESAEMSSPEASLEAELRDPDELFALESMEPNPTAGATQISFVLSGGASSDVFLGVYDVSGRLVRILASGVRAPGRHQATWDGRDTNGLPMRNGAYFVMGRVGAQKIGGRLILVR